MKQIPRHIRPLKILASFFASVIFFIFFENHALAQWSLNVGYNNPPGAIADVNALYFKGDLAFEGGLGWGRIQGSDEEKPDLPPATAHWTFLGDINAKMLYRSGFFRPYVQGGIGLKIDTALGNTNKFGLITGQPFIGGGFFLFMSKIYVYTSANVARYGWFPQIGIGFIF